MNYYIELIEYYLPGKIIDNKFLAEECGIDADFLKNKIGINTRHISSSDEGTSELAFKAAQKLITDNKIATEEIDLLLVCTQNPDYRLPTTACIVQDKLGLKKNSICFDINLGCSGFVYSLVIAGNFIKAGIAKSALLIMADEYSKIIDYKDKNTASLFGDAASAIYLNACQDNYGVLDAIFGTDGSGAHHLIVHNSGVLKDATKSPFLYMNGREIYKFSIQVVPKSVDDLLIRNKLSVKDIRYFIFHQANKFMLSEIRDKLNIAEGQMIFDMEDYGNTVSSTIPIVYRNLISKGMINKGDLLVFCGFGVGLSWATLLYRFN